jgi:hypothetical protein
VAAIDPDTDNYTVYKEEAIVSVEMAFFDGINLKNRFCNKQEDKSAYD